MMYHIVITICLALSSIYAQPEHTLTSQTKKESSPQEQEKKRTLSKLVTLSDDNDTSENTLSGEHPITPNVTAEILYPGRKKWKKKTIHIKRDPSGGFAWKYKKPDGSGRIAEKIFVKHAIKNYWHDVGTKQFKIRSIKKIEEESAITLTHTVAIKKDGTSVWKNYKGSARDVEYTKKGKITKLTWVYRNGEEEIFEKQGVGPFAKLISDDDNELDQRKLTEIPGAKKGAK